MAADIPTRYEVNVLVSAIHMLYIDATSYEEALKLARKFTVEDVLEAYDDLVDSNKPVVTAVFSDQWLP